MREIIGNSAGMSPPAGFGGILADDMGYGELYKYAIHTKSGEVIFKAEEESR